MLRRNLLALSLSALATRLSAQDLCKDCPNLSPDNPWKELEDGNGRFRGTPQNRQDKCRIRCTAAVQRPFAIILACADSRVPPEVLFDQRIGELFVVRVAGNVASDEAIGSIEYILKQPQPPKLLVVLGHGDCGAVSSAIKAGSVDAMIPSVLNRIYPAIQGITDVEKAIRANVALTVRVLPRYSPVIRNSRIAIVGAYYSVKDGTVSKV